MKDPATAAFLEWDSTSNREGSLLGKKCYYYVLLQEWKCIQETF